MQTQSSSDDDSYDILGVSASADNETIRKAFRKLALQHHPDKLPVGSSHEPFTKEETTSEKENDENKKEKREESERNDASRREKESTKEEEKEGTTESCAAYY